MQGLYIHIPFCASRCIYCDFYSTTRLSERNRYVDALTQELKMRSSEIGDAEKYLSTIYIGGGTPSQLSTRHISLLFDTIQKYFNVSSDAEVTIECNPEDINDDFLHGLRGTPVNRLSMGIQTFSDERLRFLRRRHTSSKATEAVESCKLAGFTNISIDLMFGFPGETPAEWEHDLSQAFSLQVPHISAYSLMYEEGTALSKMRESGIIRSTDDETCNKMYSLLLDRAESNGYIHYEISNFCLPGFHSRHNRSYWQGIPYIGIGAAAHSFDGQTRRWNISDLKKYIHIIENGEKYWECEILNQNDKYNEYVMTRLRTQEGIDIHEFQNIFENKYFQYLTENASKHIVRGDLVQEKGKIHLSRRGIFISDSIISDLFMI